MITVKDKGASDMKQNKAVLRIVGSLVVIAVGISCFLIGRQVTDGKYRKERELNILIHRSDLEGPRPSHAENLPQGLIIYWHGYGIYSDRYPA